MASLRKNSNTGIFLGVCSGINEWTNGKIHVHALRIGFVIGAIISLGMVGGGYIVLAGILSDTAQCGMIRKRNLLERTKLLLKPWWKKDFNPNDY